MKYALIKNTIDLVEAFDSSNANQNYSNDIIGFKKWIAENYAENANVTETYWEGKENGRTADSAISTLLVHMNRFAKNYSKAAISGSEFSTQEDFIYLINLKAFGEMTKMELIKKNVHEKPVGILIINRLITKGWVIQEESKKDKRSKVIAITNEGLQVLESQMGKIRKATNMVTGNLTETEKTELIRLLSKLNDFHKPIYEMNLDPENLLDIKNN